MVFCSGVCGGRSSGKKGQGSVDLAIQEKITFDLLYAAEGKVTAEGDY